VKVHTQMWTTFAFEELSEEAQTRAVETIADKLAGDWWDMGDTEAVSEIMLYTLAERFKSPGWDTYGSGDFPGIDGLTVEGWDVDRSEYDLRGWVTRRNAPGLPWVEGIDSVGVNPRGWYDPHPVDYDNDEESPELLAAAEVIVQAIEDAIHAALKAGRTEVEYLGSEERAREYIEINEPEFTEEGDLA